MRRLALLPLTALALGLVVWTARVNALQEPNPPIEVHRITDKLHMLGSGSTTGGNTALLIAEHGAVLVDTKNEGYGADILQMDRCGAEAGHLIVFDRAPDRTWEDKIFRREAPPGAGRAPVTVWGM